MGIVLINERKDVPRRCKRELLLRHISQEKSGTPVIESFLQIPTESEVKTGDPSAGEESRRRCTGSGPRWPMDFWVATWIESTSLQKKGAGYYCCWSVVGINICWLLLWRMQNPSAARSHDEQKWIMKSLGISLPTRIDECLDIEFGPPLYRSCVGRNGPF